MRGGYFVGLDIAKNIFQIFLADGKVRATSNQKMKPAAMTAFFVQLPPSTVGVEACGTAHHWARKLKDLGHEVKLIQPQRVKAFLGQHNKTDAADARAICEALMHTCFVRAGPSHQFMRYLHRSYHLLATPCCGLADFLIFLQSMKTFDPALIQPCLACGLKSAHLEAMRLEGRKQDVWRVGCVSCGQTSQWSVSQGAAIRAWNRHLAAEAPPSQDRGR